MYVIVMYLRAHLVHSMWRLMRSTLVELSLDVEDAMDVMDRLNGLMKHRSGVELLSRPLRSIPSPMLALNGFPKPSEMQTHYKLALKP